MKCRLSILTLCVLALGCGGGGTNPGSALDTSPDVPVADTSTDVPVAVDTLPETDGGTVEDASPDVDATPTPDVPVDPLESCKDALVPALEWFPPQDAEALPGLLEFGQTHVTQADEKRLAPPVTVERETLLLFTPDEPIPETADVRVVALEGDTALGVLRLDAPNMLPKALEQGLTATPLEPYSASAWSATLPWHWVRNGVSLRVGVLDGETLRANAHTLESLGAPHRFNITRTHIVLFGDEDYAISPPYPSAKIARDFHGSLPGAEVRWVNTSVWRLDGMVVNTAEGPRWAHSEEERLAITTDANRWKILKHQAALRLSLANTGRGLRLTSPPQGDSSPYSFGTSVAQGWVHNGSGNYSDINNAGLAAGWTGWSGMWLNECGNGFIHEVGHSCTLAHFTGGTSAKWGITEEYPNDGVNLSGHPWGYDTTRRAFRTWYRVNNGGVVTNENGWVGKRDPMNGGESANAITCFPQYTGYHARKIQAWQQNSPTITNVDGVPGIYRWDVALGAYVLEDPAQGNQRPIAVGGPVITVIGTLGNLDEVCQTYPPIFLASGNAFELPDPMDPELPALFAGAQWFLAITYQDGSTERALIKKAAIPESDTGLTLYSLNLDATRNPVQVDLYRSAVAYPNLTVADATLIHTRVIEAPTEPVPAIQTVGRGKLANAGLTLKQWCDAGLNCDGRALETTFLYAKSPIHFAPKDAADSEPVLCGAQGDVSAWSIPVTSDEGASATIVVHAQRVITAGSQSVAVPALDQTPWLVSPDTTQGLRIWIPYSENMGLTAGRYRSETPYEVSALKEDGVFHDIPIEIDLRVHSVTPIAIPPNYKSEGIAIPEGDPKSSLYYVFEDGGIGPSGSHWWGDNTGNIITVPVMDVDSGDAATLVLRAHKIACGDWWGINTGQSADWGCTHKVHLQLEDGANASLVSGHTYSSPGSHPVVIKGVRWHQPNAGQVLGILALDITHTAP
jgi:hypothetical protein